MGRGERGVAERKSSEGWGGRRRKKEQRRKRAAAASAQGVTPHKEQSCRARKEIKEQWLPPPGCGRASLRLIACERASSSLMFVEPILSYDALAEAVKQGGVAVAAPVRGEHPCADRV
jgi:hypothetical protein